MTDHRPDPGEALTGDPARRVPSITEPEDARPAVGATQILLIRHGQSEWNALGRGHGWGDPPLSPDGEEQARRAVAGLRTQELSPGVLSSDLVRARRTAELVAEPLGLAPVDVTPDLREHDIGEWDGKTWEEIERHWPGAQQAWVAEEIDTPPGGESRADLHARVERALRRLAEQRRGERCLVVAHGGVVRAVERLAGVEPTPIEHLSGRWVSVTDGTLRAGDRFWAVRPDARDF